MKNVFKYPYIIVVMVVAIVFEGYAFKEDLSQMNIGFSFLGGETLAEHDASVLNEKPDGDEGGEDEIPEIDVITSHEKPPVVSHAVELSGDYTKPPTGDPYEILPQYADKYIDGIFDGVYYTEASEDYFDDACFIGDSRMEGLYEYGGFDNSDFYYLTGLSLYDCFKKDLKTSKGGKTKLETALKNKQYGKIYLMFGVNELGTGTDEMFGEEYARVIEEIHKLQPNAIIYVHGILWVTKSKANSSSYIKNTKIDSRNLEVQKVIDNDVSYYLEINSLFGDGVDNLDPAYSGDEVHLYAKYYNMWADYLKAHAVVRR